MYMSSDVLSLAAVIEDAETGAVYNAPVGFGPKVLSVTYALLTTKHKQIKKLTESFVK